MRKIINVIKKASSFRPTFWFRSPKSTPVSMPESESILEETQRYTRGLIEANLDALVTIAVNGKITDVNKASEQATGVSREQLIGTDFCDYFTDPHAARAGYQHVFRDGLVRDYPLELKHCDGSIIPVLYNASVYKDAHGEVAGVFAAARDITERKQAEVAAEATQHYTRGLIEANLDALVTISSQGKITDVNKASEQATGVSREQLIGTDFSDYFTDPIAARAGYQQVFRDGLVRDYPLELKHCDGSIIPVLYNASVYKDAHGAVAGVFAAARDITERKQAEAAAEATQHYTRGLIEANLDALVTISSQGKIMDVNKASEQATGFSREQLIGTDFSDYFTDPHAARAGYQHVFRDGLVHDYPLELKHCDGSIIPVLYNASVYKDSEGKVTGVFAAARDISERKLAAEKLEQRNAELRSIVKSMAGRETRMAELKRVIKELHAQLEEAGMRPVADDPLKK